MKKTAKFLQIKSNWVYIFIVKIGKCEQILLSEDSKMKEYIIDTLQYLIISYIFYLIRMYEFVYTILF